MKKTLLVIIACVFFNAKPSDPSRTELLFKCGGLAIAGAAAIRSAYPYLPKDLLFLSGLAGTGYVIITKGKALTPDLEETINNTVTENEEVKDLLLRRHSKEISYNKNVRRFFFTLFIASSIDDFVHSRSITDTVCLTNFFIPALILGQQIKSYQKRCIQTEAQSLMVELQRQEQDAALRERQEVRALPLSPLLPASQQRHDR